MPFNKTFSASPCFYPRSACHFSIFNIRPAGITSQKNSTFFVHNTNFNIRINSIFPYKLIETVVILPPLIAWRRGTSRRRNLFPGRINRFYATNSWRSGIRYRNFNFLYTKNIFVFIPKFNNANLYCPPKSWVVRHGSPLITV